MPQQKFIGWFIAGVMIIVLGVAATPVLADTDLPDRNLPVENENSDDDAPLGATIELTAWPPGADSVVQWQDINGHWQSVDGWHGSLDNTGYIRWWVAVKDFGTGPFRWVVGQSNSAPFNLPAGAGQTLTVETEQK
jgi:hypothetical protein